MLCVFTISIRLIIGSLIAYTFAAAAHLMSMPPVAITMDTSSGARTALAYETEVRTERTQQPVIDGHSVEQKVRTYFADVPIMIEVARCESEFRQLDPHTGEIFRGWMNPRDLGVMQINEMYHGETAEQLGIDIHTLDGNLKYARYLYNSSGTQPWNASRYCWGGGGLAFNQ